MLIFLLLSGEDAHDGGIIDPEDEREDLEGFEGEEQDGVQERGSADTSTEFTNRQLGGFKATMKSASASTCILPCAH